MNIDKDKLIKKLETHLDTNNIWIEMVNEEGKFLLSDVSNLKIKGDDVVKLLERMDLKENTFSLVKILPDNDEFQKQSSNCQNKIKEFQDIVEKILKELQETQ